MIATRAAGLARLADFLPQAGRRYAERRNEDHGPGAHLAVSMLSPYVRRRAVPEWDVLRAVLDAHGSRAAKFVDEVFWRTYWKGWLERHPAAWTRFCERLAEAQRALAGDGELHARHQAACEGRTGVVPFDAWAAELVATNYLHNHARMWFASIWIFTLQLPWELGAAFFLRHLLDGDPAANTLSWRWVAGLHTRGKTYRARRDNIVRHTGARLDPGDALARTAPALVDEPIPARALPEVPPLHVGRDDYVVLHDDDLGIDAFVAAFGTPGAGGVLSARDALIPGGVAAAVTAFVDGLAADALANAAAHGIRTSPRIVASADALLDAVQATGARRIVAPYAPVGPVRDALDTIAARARARNLAYAEGLHEYDRAAWPFAARGFFGLRAHIPDVLAAIGITVRTSGTPVSSPA